MNNQEAIKWLREAEILDLASGNTKDREAVDLAVEAMREELSKNSPKLDKENGDLQPTCNQLATGTISRQAAIDAMAELQGRASTKAELKGISKAWKRIKQLPSAQHEREYTMEEFMFGQDMGNPEDGSL